MDWLFASSYLVVASLDLYSQDVVVSCQSPVVFSPHCSIAVVYRASSGLVYHIWSNSASGGRI